MSEQENNIQKYIHGLLTDTELENFEKYMSEHLEFQNEVKNQMLIQAAASKLRDQELMERMTNLEVQIESNSSINYRVFLRWAAVLVLITLPLYYFLTSSEQTDEELYLAYFEPYPNVLGPSRADDAQVIDGLVDYEAEAYEKAVQKLSGSLSSGVQNSNGVKLYLGISLMETNAYEDAINIFKTIPDTSRFINQSKWYTSLALLGQNKAKDAIPLLEELETGSSYSDQASDLLAEISE